jgi:hypothetical protein
MNKTLSVSEIIGTDLIDKRKVTAEEVNDGE